MKHKRNHKEAGITLVALAVTIIVLLILTGVTINLALKDNGIIGKAQESSNIYANVNKDEMTARNQLSDQISRLRRSEDSGGGSQTGGLTGVDFGEKTATTIAPGEDLTITIGNVTESFRVLSTDNSTSIVAVPFYNITLDTSNPVQTDVASGNTISFSTNAYWEAGTDTIDMTDSRNNIQQYITAYSNKLSAATNGKVTARVARYSEMNATGVTNAIRNPGKKRAFWLGSASGTYANNRVWFVWGNRHNRLVPEFQHRHRRCPSCNSNQPIINQKEAKPLTRSRFLEETAPANGHLE